MNRFEKMNFINIFIKVFSESINLYLLAMGFKPEVFSEGRAYKKTYLPIYEDGKCSTVVGIFSNKVCYTQYDIYFNSYVDGGSFEIPEEVKGNLEEFINFMGEVFDSIDFE